jgi:protoheme IX farnesyltransferase
MRNNITPLLRRLAEKARSYCSLMKNLQTGLLLTTGLAGYMTARCPLINWNTLLMLGVSMFLAISGSTILNMWYDRDIDAKMRRTCRRPMPSGDVNPGEGLALGLVLSFLGVGLALFMDGLYGLVVFAGLFINVVIYTIWLKRRTPWSVVWGGIAGGMPVLAGRVLGTSQIDWIGITLMLAVLFWIPTHILTFSIRYAEDYREAGIPTFPSVYGTKTTRFIISISSVLAAVSMGVAAFGIGLTWGYLRLLAVLSSGLLLLAIGGAVRPSESVNFGLFKYASLYMLIAMLLLVFTSL